MQSKLKRIVIFLVGLLAIAALFLGYRFIKQKDDRQKYDLAYRLLEKRKNILLNLERDILKEAIEFNQEYGILIKDLKSGYSIVLNGGLILPSASLVKIPIMACVYCADKEGRINLKQKVSLKNSDKTLGAGILKNMSEGMTFEIEELVYLMIAYSDNTATNILIDLLGLDYLNSCFKNLGLRDTNISRRILDNKAREKGLENYTTSRDIGYLLEAIYKRELLGEEISEKCLRFLRQNKMRDRIPALLPQDITVANKTGLESGICHDAGIVFTKEGDFLICVLIRHNFKTAQPAKQFISRVVQRLYLAFNKDE